LAISTIMGRVTGPAVVLAGEAALAAGGCAAARNPGTRSDTPRTAAKEVRLDMV
jgi:hypothetical protein